MRWRYTMQQEVSTYEKQANDFLALTNTTFKAVYLKNDKYFVDDKDYRDIYTITLKNANGSYKFKFGQSIANSGKKQVPTAYDVLSCLQTYDFGNFEDFCSAFGYDKYNPETGKKCVKAAKIYNAVCSEYENICRLFSDEQVELLQEMQ